MKRILAVRQDNNGDVLLTDPALRALSAAGKTTLLCGPRGLAAARLLTGVDVLCYENPAIDANPSPVKHETILAFVNAIHERCYHEAVIFTSFHQDPLPLALLLRMAGIPRIGAISENYPGNLVDVRHRVADDVHEVERNLSLVHAMGYESPLGDDLRLRMRFGKNPVPASLTKSYIVVHPGATVPARTWTPKRWTQLVRTLLKRGERVVLTGDASERELGKDVAANASSPLLINTIGSTTFAEFAAVVRDARTIVCGNTAAAHVASAAGTPIVEIFPPTIPAVRFAPWKTPYVLLGDQNIACRGCRARFCAIPRQPCIGSISIGKVLGAIESLRMAPFQVAEEIPA